MSRPLCVCGHSELLHTHSYHTRCIFRKCDCTGFVERGTLSSNTEAINHPSHYNQGSMEVIEAIEGLGLNFCEGNVLKYMTRRGHKGVPESDARKMTWYFCRMLGVPYEAFEEARDRLSQPASDSP